MRIGFNPNIISRSPINADIKAKLLELGLSSTGSPEGDIAISKAAMAKKAQNSSKLNEEKGINHAQGMKHPEPPWFSLMKSLGIEPTGSKDGDFAAMTAKIGIMESQATTEGQLSTVKGFKTELATFTGGGSDSGMQQNNQDKSAFAGQEQLASMNRWFIINSQI